MKDQNNSTLLPFNYTFKLKYHPNDDKEYLDKAVLSFDKAYKFYTKVTQIKVNNVVLDTLPKNVYIHLKPKVNVITT